MRDRIVAALEAVEDALPTAMPMADRPPGRFVRKPWKRTDHTGGEGGGGVMGIMHGRVFEKVGVHVSTVHGEFAPEFRKQMPGAEDDPRFFATGVSMIAHPWNPNVPTVHMNVRFFVAGHVWWFGGGMDLTPYYPVEEDCVHFHRANRDALAPFPGLHARFKAACDEYFFLKHRGEPRGIGGTFFDDYSEGGFDASFAVMRAVGDAFLPAYAPIVEKRRDAPYGERERDFQAYRRGRYVEFNLVWDRGTLFGLQSGGRAESILMSLPPIVRWRYDWKPAPGSPEAKLAQVLMPPRDWVNLA
ncbi:MAG: oxygen-dependent coproporphyrinogen oxidase [Usitatibacter sp.]